MSVQVDRIVLLVISCEVFFVKIAPKTLMVGFY